MKETFTVEVTFESSEWEMAYDLLHVHVYSVHIWRVYMLTVSFNFQRFRLQSIGRPSKEFAMNPTNQFFPKDAKDQCAYAEGLQESSLMDRNNIVS